MRFVAVFLVALAVPSAAYAQDPIKVDPKHYKVEFENEQVRVLRITYAPGERSITHQHPNAVAVMLTDSDFQMTLPDGKAERTQAKRGSVL